MVQELMSVLVLVQTPKKARRAMLPTTGWGTTYFISPSTCSPHDAGVKTWTSSQNFSTSLLQLTAASPPPLTPGPRVLLLTDFHHLPLHRPPHVSVARSRSPVVCRQVH